MDRPLVRLPLQLLPRNSSRDGLSSYDLRRIFSLPLLAVARHWAPMAGSLLSACLCIATGHTTDTLVDPMFFKSLLIFFGVTMGFRNTYANQRRIQTMDNLHRLVSAFWGIFISLPSTSQHKVRGPIKAAFAAVVGHLPTVSHRSSSWYSVVGLHPVDDGLPLDDRRDTFVMPSPRAMLVKMSILIEEEVERIEQGHAQKLRRNLWFHKAELLESYDRLIPCIVPAVSGGYLAFIDFCRLLYVVVFPFAVQSLTVTLHVARLGLHWEVSPDVILLAMTMLVSLFMYSLEVITYENENPFGAQKEEDDLGLRHLNEVFDRTAMAIDDVLPNSIAISNDHESVEEAFVGCGPPSPTPANTIFASFAMHKACRHGGYLAPGAAWELEAKAHLGLPAMMMQEA